MSFALDLFCGAGGASLGLRAAGYDVLGLDKWADAVATHENNGMPADEVDLSTASPDTWRWFWRDRVDLMWGSPPCQPFSQGGKQVGRFDERDGFPWFLAAVEGVLPRAFVMENVKGLTFKKHSEYLAEIVRALEALGYVVDYRVLNCADYGVPQKRQRLFVVGRRDGHTPRFPEPTHSDGAKVPGTAAWVTMADALGWSESTALRPERGTGMAERHGPRRDHPATEPAPTVTSHPRRFAVVGTDTVTSRDRAIHGPTDAKSDWVYDNPACTVVGTFSPDCMAPPTYRRPGDGPRQKQPGTVRITVEEALVLQGFPERFQVLGSRSSQFMQVGNAVPPVMAQLLAEANVAQVTYGKVAA